MMLLVKIHINLQVWNRCGVIESLFNILNIKLINNNSSSNILELGTEEDPLDIHIESKLPGIRSDKYDMNNVKNFIYKGDVAFNDLKPDIKIFGFKDDIWTLKIPVSIDNINYSGKDEVKLTNDYRYKLYFNMTEGIEGYISYSLGRIY